jgi:hypothetical protein
MTENLTCHSKRNVGIGFCRECLPVDLTLGRVCANCRKTRVSSKDNKVTEVKQA